MKGDKGKVRLVANPVLLFEGLLLFGSELLTCFIMLYVSRNDEIDISRFWIVLTVLAILSTVIGLPKCLVIVEFGQTGIRVKRALKRPIEKEYDCLYISQAHYMYYGFKRIDFIVFSERRLTNDELCHINQVPVSDKTVKIRIREKSVRKLKTVLPPKYALKLNLNMR